MINRKHRVLVIGAAGRVGYPFCGYAAKQGYEVWGYDINPQQWKKAEEYIEEDIPPLHLRQFLQSSNRPTYENWISQADTIVIMIGTPVDAEGNPRTDGINKIREDLALNLKNRTRDVLIVLRSTVSPGTTDVFRDTLNKKLIGSSCKAHVVFAPERIAQGKTYIEMPKLHQLIGYKTEEEARLAVDFFKDICPSWATINTRAAELGKLFTNMYRYVNFALANEFMMIAHTHGVDYEIVRQSVNYKYPRMNLERAGPNSAGPCLFKDGTFLVDHIPYTDLIRSSFAINEGMPAWIYWNFIAEITPTRVAILGMSFKGNNDDARYSLSFKMKKILDRQNIEAVCYDPLIPEFRNTLDLVKTCDVVIVMTPHDAFDTGFFRDHVRSEALVIDVWKHFERSGSYLNGVFLNYEDES